MDGISSLVVPSFGGPSGTGGTTLSGADWGTQDAAGYWSGWGSPLSAEETANIAAKTAADRQAIADFEAAMRAQAGPQEINTSGSFGPGHGSPSTQSTQQDTSGLKSLAPLLLMGAAFGGSPTVVQSTPAPVVGAAQFSDRRKPRGYAEGGQVDYADLAKRLQEAGVGGGGFTENGYVYTPVWQMSSGGENDYTGLQNLSHFMGTKEGSTYGDTYDIYDTAGNKTGTGVWEAPDIWDKLGPTLAMSLIGYAGLQGLMGAGNVAGGPDFSSGFTDGGTAGGALDTAYATGSAGTPSTTLTSGAVLPNGTGGVGGAGLESLSSNYVNPKALLDGTNSFGANSAPNALDISSLEAATTASGADAAVTGIAQNLGYTTPAAFGGSPTVPGGTAPSITDKIASAGSGFLDKILSDPFKAAGLLALLAGAKDIGGGSGGGQYAGYSGGIPNLTASRTRIARDPNRRPGSAPQRAFTDVEYKASGGIVGLLKGGGTGMSDDIPATIEGNQPARLARDEYVVAADVVSALGDGSSEAGAEILDQMMQRVRHAAHGKTDQQRRVNPKQVLPA